MMTTDMKKKIRLYLKTYSIILIVMIAMLGFACTSENDLASEGVFSSLKIVDFGGSEGPSLSSEIVKTYEVFSDGKLTYKEEVLVMEGDNGYVDVIEDFLFYMADVELDYLESLIVDSAVNRIQDVMAPQDAAACSGFEDIMIDFDDGEGTTNSFRILGEARCNDYIPEALQELLDFVNDLVLQLKEQRVII